MQKYWFSSIYNKANWTVDLIDTGIDTLTGGRIKQLSPYLDNETFMLTWGDGVSNVNLHDLLRFHESHGKLATLAAVRPTARFGHLELDGLDLDIKLWPRSGHARRHQGERQKNKACYG